MSNWPSDAKKRVRSSVIIDHAPLVAIGGIAATVVIASLLTLAGASAVSVLGAVVVTSAATALVTHWAASGQRRRLERLIDDQRHELEHWQQRWRELQRETQEATSALSRMRDGVIMLSGEAKILLINPAARWLLRVAEDLDVNLRPFAEVVRIPELTRAIAAANAGDGIQKLLVEVPHDDRVCPVKIRVDRFAVTGNNSLLITLRDETESHRLDEMRREFIANISHELKTPLAAIKGYAETVELAIKDDPDAAVHFMTQIHSQCLRLERLIADMMQLARAQAGRSHLNIVSISMVDAIAESMKSYRPVAEAKRVKLEFRPSDSTPVVRSDPEAMLTITNNLIGNAIRYTPEGGSVTVSCRDAGKFWALAVEDTGVGISETDQKRIFERFYRVGKSRGTGDGGTGIGLSIVKNLTLTLGGEVRLSSRPGEGSKFEILLPKAESSPTARQATAHSTPSHSHAVSPQPGSLPR